MPPALSHATGATSASGRLRRRWRGVRRSVLARRRLLAAMLAALAAVSGLRALSPPPVATRTVLVAAVDLAPGTLLVADDLSEAQVPDDLVPPRPVAEAAGRVLASGLDAGEPVTETRLVGPGLGDPGGDQVAVPVRLPDAQMASLLQVGDRVDLLAADLQAGPAGSATPVATDVPVLAVGRADEGGGVTGLPGRLLVVGVDGAEVGAVAQASAAAFVTFAWSPG